MNPAEDLSCGQGSGQCGKISETSVSILKNNSLYKMFLQYEDDDYTKLSFTFILGARNLVKYNELYEGYLPNIDIKFDYNKIIKITTPKDWFHHLEEMNPGLKEYSEKMNSLMKEDQNKKKTLKIMLVVVECTILLVLIFILHTKRVHTI